MKVISMEVLQANIEFSRSTDFETNVYTRQIVRPLVKVSVVEIIFFLEDGRRHDNDHVYGESRVRFHHSLESIASDDIDIGGFRVRKLVGGMLVGFWVGERNRDLVTLL